MFGLGRRAIDLAILFLAAYAFTCVPLRKHTGLELFGAILRTHAARDATREIGEALGRMKERIWKSTSAHAGDSEPAPAGRERGDSERGSEHEGSERGRPVPQHGTPVLPKFPRRAPATVGEAPADDFPDASL